MSSVERDVRKLLKSSMGLPNGPGRIAICEEAVRLADAHGDYRLGFSARNDLVEATQFGGRPDLSLVAFAWCLAQYDAHPGEFDSFQLLWRYKWIATDLPSFPQISREKIEEVLADMERRYLAYGSTTQPIWHKRRVVAQMMGDLKIASAAHREFRKLPRTMLSDCHACEVNGTASYYFEIGKQALGLSTSEQVLLGGMRCASVPHTTYGIRLLPLLRAGRGAEAMEHHRVGYPMAQSNHNCVSACSQHMTFLALTGNDAKALRLLERHVADAIDGFDPHREYNFCRQAWIALEVIAHRRTQAKLRLPQISMALGGAGEFMLADLAHAFKERLFALAERFDRRNGNDYYTDLANKMRSWKKYATPIPLDGGGTEP